VTALAAALQGGYTEVVDEDALRAMLAGLARPDEVDAETWEAGLEMAAAAIDGTVV